MNVRDIPTRQLLSMLTRGNVAEEDLQRPLLEVFKQPSRADYPMQLLVAGELMERAFADSLRERPLMSDPKAVRQYLQVYFAGYEHEAMVCMYLDAKLKLIDLEEIFRGTLTQCTVYPREIVKAAIKRNCAYVLVAHNHPSGESAPSRADERITGSIREALATIDVALIDHVIVSGTSCYSFAEMGVL